MENVMIKASESLIEMARRRARVFDSESRDGLLRVGNKFGYQDYYVAREAKKLVVIASFTDDTGDRYFVGLRRYAS